MDCSDFSFEKKSIHDWIWDLSGDEFIVLMEFQKSPLLEGTTWPSVLFEMHCKGLLLKAEFPDQSKAYKPAPGVMLEFEQYLREHYPPQETIS
jgi:hypothetical protein